MSAVVVSTGSLPLAENRVCSLPPKQHQLPPSKVLEVCEVHSPMAPASDFCLLILTLPL